jgi:hypothetical protein
MADIPKFPSLADLATFIDSVKNVVFALIFVFAGFYVTVTPGVTTEYAGQWVGAAMTVAGFYIGTRAEKGKQLTRFPVTAEFVGEPLRPFQETEEAAKQP